MGSPSVSNNPRPTNYQPTSTRDVQEPRTVVRGPAGPAPAPAPTDGVEPPPATNANTEPKATEPKAPATDTQAAVNQANREAIAELKKHNAFELMKMVRSGDIPAAILDNPVAMNLMLERVQDFSRMIQMMTNMMQVEHEMLTSIIRNIKA